MSLIARSSPHNHAPVAVAGVMSAVLLATLPGIVALTVFFGPGVLINLALGIPLALLCEWSVLRMRGLPTTPYLRDYSVVVTAVLLCVALPPYAPWWLVSLGIVFAVGLGKHIFGGLGFNPFNPAMVGYVVLLISFPLQMSMWQAPLGVGELPSLLDSLRWVFFPKTYDAVTAATPLDLLRQNEGLLVEDLYRQYSQFGQWAGLGWEWVNLAFLGGGAWLLYKRIFTWHAPLAMLTALGLCAWLGYDGGSSNSGGSPLFHWLSGGTMLGAFFIITDPVSSAVSNRGRLIFGALIGVLIYIIRTAGHYPDAVAFAVLVLNFAAPFIDHYTQPTVYGQGKS